MEAGQLDDHEKGGPHMFDVFLSYAHVDDARGWVTALHRQILADSRAQGRELRVFMDTSDIHTMQDWDLRIKDGLRQSRLLLVCLSPAYLASEFCRREWDDFVLRTAKTAGDTKAVAYFVSLPDSDPAEVDAWRARLEAVHHTDLREWFTEGPEALEREDVRRRVTELGDSLYERIERQRTAARVPGNLRGASPFFVGREDDLLRLRRAVGTREAPVTVVHGLGGMGKTELVIQYAHLDRDRFSGGVVGGGRV